MASSVIVLNDLIHDRVEEMLRSETRGQLLDVGAGDGTLSVRLRDLGYAVRACDLVIDHFEPTDIAITRADLNTELPFRTGEFDAVVATEVIEHVENPWGVIRELYRITRPGGVVVLSTPNLDNIFVRIYFLLTGHLYNFLDRSYRDIGHITPVFLWNLRRMTEDTFDVEWVTVNASPIPKTNIRLPSRSLWLGQCIVVKLRRKAGPETMSQKVWQEACAIRPSL